MAAAFRGTAYRFGVFTEFFSPPSSIYSLSLSLLFFSPFLLIDSERLFFFLLSSYRIFSEFAFTEWSTPPTGCRYTVGLVSLGFFFYRVFQPIIRASGQREREREMSKRWVSAVFAPDSTPAPSRSTTNKTQTQKKKNPVEFSVPKANNNNKKRHNPKGCAGAAIIKSDRPTRLVGGGGGGGGATTPVSRRRSGSFPTTAAGHTAAAVKRVSRS